MDELLSDTRRAAAQVDMEAAAAALRKLHADHPVLATSIASLIHVLAGEALHNPRFARDLEVALAGPKDEVPEARRPKRGPGVIDPFAVHLDVGEEGLRAALAILDTEQLKDIVAECAMDYDKRAMRWRSAERLRERIVERVIARATKGEAFRG
ncbi:hypothetical protein [Aldersonia kunmingensis]|uniref:hypothetical protein n=1 Tax=Aldersonia kunmingensis TaxID=408066 RepID=UPI0012EE2009|nr:hypothetical protein [Aldersonia kunmingensis]